MSRAGELAEMIADAYADLDGETLHLFLDELRGLAVEVEILAAQERDRADRLEAILFWPQTPRSGTA